jgi:hypothetical protein
MKLKHTPGKWECNYKLRTAINAGEKHIAMVNFFNDGSDSRSVCGDEHEANARLIAAAPEMLDHIIEDATDELSNDYWVNKPFVEWKMARSRLVKIIESATGLPIDEVLK